MPNIVRYIIGLFLIFPGILVADDRLVINADQSNDFECAFVLKGEKAEFRFIDEASRYPDKVQWNEKAGSAIEYSWLVYFDRKKPNSNPSYRGIDFGIRYFMTGADAKTGTLSQLFKDSDLISFTYYDDGTFVPDYLDELIAEIIGSDIVLVLEKTESTSFVFDRSRKLAYFWVIVQGEKPMKCRGEKKVE